MYYRCCTGFLLYRSAKVVFRLPYILQVVHYVRVPFESNSVDTRRRQERLDTFEPRRSWFNSSSNPRDSLDAEIAAIVNSIAHRLPIECVDPQLRTSPREGEKIRAQYTFSNLLVRKTVPRANNNQIYLHIHIVKSARMRQV